MSSIQRLGLAAMALFVIAAAAPSGTTTMSNHGCWACHDLDKSVETCEEALKKLSGAQLQAACNAQCSSEHGPWTATTKCMKDPTGGKFCEGAKNPFVFKCWRDGGGGRALTLVFIPSVVPLDPERASAPATRERG